MPDDNHKLFNTLLKQDDWIKNIIIILSDYKYKKHASASKTYLHNLNIHQNIICKCDVI